MKYDLDKTVVHCTTQEQFNKVLEWHKMKNKIWNDIEKISNQRCYDLYKEDTYLSLGENIIYGNVNDKNVYLSILPFSQFERDFVNMEVAEQPEPSVKNDFKDNKLRWDLLPLDLIEEVVKVYHAGAKKYGANRWQNLEDGENRYFGAMMRHIRASQIEDIDEDTGCYHLAQVCFNALALLHFKLKEKEE